MQCSWLFVQLHSLPLLWHVTVSPPPQFHSPWVLTTLAIVSLGLCLGALLQAGPLYVVGIVILSCVRGLAPL
jgi:hypothetical protein